MLKLFQISYVFGIRNIMQKQRHNDIHRFLAIKQFSITCVMVTFIDFNTDTFNVDNIQRIVQDRIFVCTFPSFHLA